MVVRTYVNGTPDCWSILKFSHENDTVYKLFRGDYGGYLGEDTWNLNSGIVSYTDEGDAVVIEGSSGSRYRCFKGEGRERFTGLMSSVYAGWINRLAESNSTMTFEVVTFEQFTQEFKPFDKLSA